MGIDKDKSMPAVASGLRRRAEDHLGTKKSEAVLPHKNVETLRLLHELEVHRVELEMQNAELRQARDEAEQHLGKYSDLYDFAPVGYFTLDGSGTITSVNLRGASLVGVARARLVGRNFGLLVTHEYRTVFTEFIRSVFINRDKTECEVAIESKDNRTVIVLLEAMAAISGQECGLVMVDITERKLLEEQLQQNERRYRTVVEDQTEVICRLSVDGTFSFVNDVYCRVFDKKAEDLLGNNWEPTVFPDDLTNIKEQLRTMSPTNPVVVIENRVYNGSGAIRWMQFVNRGSFDLEGRLLEIQSVGRDITERKKSEEELRNYARRLAEIEEELRNKIATELHDEICRDLTVLGMNMAIISDGMKDVVPKILTARAKVSSNIIKSISHTVRNIMAGLRPPMLEDFGLQATLRWHSDLFSKRSEIAVAFETDELFPRLAEEQETTLFRISQEALMNVVKHTDARIVTIKLRKAGGMIRFSVADDGEGFLPKGSSHIQNSSGWGLKIMRERAELIGGTFQVESVPGKGTTVSVVMPLKDL